MCGFCCVCPLKKYSRDFCGGSVVKTLYSQWRGALIGDLRSHMLPSMARKIKSSRYKIKWPTTCLECMSLLKCLLIHSFLYEVVKI